MILYIDVFVIFIVFLLHIIVLNPKFFYFSEPWHSNTFRSSYSTHQVEGYTEQEKPRDIVELARDNIFDTLSEHDKYIVLKKRSVPEANFDFPKAIKHGCNYLCKTAYLSDSFVCSCQDNAVYCIYCVLFCPQRQTEHIGCICES